MIEFQKRVTVTVDGRVITGLKVEPTNTSIFIGGGLYYTVYVNDEQMATSVPESQINTWAAIIDKVIPLAIEEHYRDK